MEIRIIRKENEETIYIGYRRDIKSLYKKLSRKGKAKGKYPGFPEFNEKKEIYGLVVKGKEMNIINSDTIIKELLRILKETDAIESKSITDVTR